MCEPISKDMARRSLIEVRARIGELSTRNPKLYQQLADLLAELTTWMVAVQGQLDDDGRAIDALDRRTAPETAVRAAALAKLTARELEVLGLGEAPAGGV